MKFGKNHAQVERFLAWYDALSPADVATLISRSLPQEWKREMLPVGKRITAAGMPATVRAALLRAVTAANEAKVAAGLKLEARDRGSLTMALPATLDALAIREKVSAEDFAVVTKGFREAGYDFDAGVAADSAS